MFLLRNEENYLWIVLNIPLIFTSDKYTIIFTIDKYTKGEQSISDGYEPARYDASTKHGNDG